MITLNDINIYDMIIFQKYETYIKISDTLVDDDKRDNYILEIKKTSTGWVYIINNKTTSQLIRLDIIPEDGSYKTDDVFGLNLHEFKYDAENDISNRSITSVLRVHNGWIYFIYNKISYHLKTIYFVPQFLNSGTNTGTYTNLTPLSVTHGGALIGSTFNNLTMQEMFDLILYPYQSPSFTSFYLNNISNSYEIGYNISINQTFIWDTNNDSNVKPNTISLIGKNLTTLNNLSNDNNENIIFNSAINRTSIDGPGIESWTIIAQNTKDISFSRNYSIRWDYIMYVGTSSLSILTESEIKLLSDFNLVRNGKNGTFNISANNYKFIAFADFYGNVNNFKDPDTTFDIDMYDGYSHSEGSWSYELISITNSFNQTTNYRLYRTTYELGSSQKITIS